MASKRGRTRKRQHTYRPAADKPGTTFTDTHLCPECGKGCYASRADAERAGRQAHPGATLRFYRCPSHGSDWWHYTSMTAAQLARIREQRAVQPGDQIP